MSQNIPNWEEVLANNDRKLRQAYLDSINPLMPDGTEGFLYIDEPNEFLRYINNMTALRLIQPEQAQSLWSEYAEDHYSGNFHIAFHVIRSPELYADGKNHVILTFPPAFNIFPDEKTLKTIAVYHEGSHAYMRKHGIYVNRQSITREEIRAMDPSTFESLDEYIALLDLQHGINEMGMRESEFAWEMNEIIAKYRLPALNYIFSRQI